MAGNDGDRSMGAAHDLAGALRSRHAALREHIGAARRGTVVGVHQARVATRRLREIVPVAADGLKGVRRRRLQRALRDLTRALGGVRECDVSLGMVDALAASAPAEVQRVTRRWVRSLRARRREARVGLTAGSAPERLAWIDARIDGLAAARAESADEAWRLRLARLLEDRAQRLRHAIEDAGVIFLIEALHDVRIAAKRLRYAIELTGACRLAPVAGPLTRLKRIQDELGVLHDLDVLLADFREHLGPPRDARDAEAHAWIEDGLERARHERHAAYLRRRASLIATADAVTDRMAPRVREGRNTELAAPRSDRAS